MTAGARVPTVVRHTNAIVALATVPPREAEVAPGTLQPELIGGLLGIGREK